jgi:hypothetical protein
MLDDFLAAGVSVESAAIAQAAFAVDPLAGNGISHTVALYINKFGPPPAADCPPNTTCIIEGETPVGSHTSYVEDPQGGGSNSRENVTAHEVGHGIAIIHDAPRVPKTENRSLMWWGRGDGDPPNPCEIRDRDWKRANPTPGDQP